MEGLTREKCLEHEKPDFGAVLASLPQGCEPYFCCMVVTCRKKGAQTTGSSSHQQRTNIYVTRQPYELVNKLNKGIPLAESDTLDLAAAIACLLPQPPTRAKKKTKSKGGGGRDLSMLDTVFQEQEDTVTIDPLPDPVPVTEEEQQQAPINNNNNNNNNNATTVTEALDRKRDAMTLASRIFHGDEWITRDVIAITFLEAYKVSLSIENGECMIEDAIEQLRRGMNQRSAANRRANMTMPMPMPMPQLPPVESCMFEEPLLPYPMLTAALKRTENEKKKRRRIYTTKTEEVDEPAPKKHTQDKPQQQQQQQSKKKKKKAISPATSKARSHGRTLDANRPIQKLGVIIGPVLTMEAAKLIGVVWSMKSRGTIPRSALGEILAERFSLNMYADLAVVFEGEDFERNAFHQTDCGELWLVEKTKLPLLKQLLSYAESKT